MIPANGAPRDLETRDVFRSLPFAQRRTRDNAPSTTFTRSHSMSAAWRPLLPQMLLQATNEGTQGPRINIWPLRLHLPQRTPTDDFRCHAGLVRPRRGPLCLRAVRLPLSGLK